MNLLFEFAEIQHLSSASVLSPLSKAIHPGYMRVALRFWLYGTTHNICDMHSRHNSVHAINISNLGIVPGLLKRLFFFIFVAAPGGVQGYVFIGL